MTSLYLIGVYYSKLIYCLFYEGGQSLCPDIPVWTNKEIWREVRPPCKNNGGPCASGSLYEQWKYMGVPVLRPPCMNNEEIWGPCASASLFEQWRYTGVPVPRPPCMNNEKIYFTYWWRILFILCNECTKWSPFDECWLILIFISWAVRQLIKIVNSWTN